MGRIKRLLRSLPPLARLAPKRGGAMTGVAFVAFGLATSVLAAPVSLEERQRLEAELAKVEQQIAETEKIIGGYQQQSQTLKNEINRLNSEVIKINLQIRAINLSINELDLEIGDNEEQVVVTESKLERQKEALRRALQGLYEQEGETIVEILLKSPTLSHFFSDVNGLLEVQAGLRSSLNELVNLRGQLIDEKENLALRRNDKASLRAYQSSQKSSLEDKKNQESNLLSVTKGQESKYQELLKESQKTAAQIRSRIFEFLGGGQLTFEQAYQLAKSASDLTGIRPAMILAVLDKESALGYNVGRCNYKEAMHPNRDIPVFLEIMEELGMSPDSVSVSCPISYDGAYGGAMGPAQFIPSTWEMFKAEIARLTGSNPPSPWNNFNAFVGTGLYLKDARDSSACRKYSKEIPSQADILLDRCAAAKYYAGGRWYRYRWTYGEGVLERAARFEEDIRRIGA